MARFGYDIFSRKKVQYGITTLGILDGKAELDLEIFYWLDLDVKYFYGKNLSLAG